MPPAASRLRDTAGGNFYVRARHAATERGKDYNLSARESSHYQSRSESSSRISETIFYAY